MAGNRYRDDDRGGSNQWRGGEDRDRGSSIFGDNGRERSSGGWQSRGQSQGGEDRGFFERAGEEVRSWLGFDDERGGQPRNPSRESQDRSEPWGGGDWAEGSGGSFGGSGGGEYRGRTQSWGEANEGGNWRGNDGGGGYRPSHYGSEHGFGGFQGDYGGGQGQGGFGGQGDYSGGRQSFSGGRSGALHDDHYRSWRDRQIAEMDRDYEEYCSECQQSFHTDFDSWRRNRQSQGGSGLGTSASTGSTGTTDLVTGSSRTIGAEEDGSGTGSTGSSRMSVLPGSAGESGTSAAGGIEDSPETAGSDRTEG